MTPPSHNEGTPPQNLNRGDDRARIERVRLIVEQENRPDLIPGGYGDLAYALSPRGTAYVARLRGALSRIGAALEEPS